MSRAYQGKDPCAGCGKPGHESWRRNKGDLCFDCEDVMKAGREAIRLKELEGEARDCSIQLFIGDATNTVHRHDTRTPGPTKSNYRCRPVYLTQRGEDGIEDYCESKRLVEAFNNLVRTIGVKKEHGAGRFNIYMEGRYGDMYKVTEAQAEALFDLYLTIGKYSRTVDKKARKEGADLLISLSRGDMTMEEFVRRTT